jgi:hypothetical protein
MLNLRLYLIEMLDSTMDSITDLPWESLNHSLSRRPLLTDDPAA